MDTQIQAKPVIYELVWRQFKATWIHERIFLYLTNYDAGERYDKLTANCLREGNPVHSFSRKENEPPKHGLPLPEKSGFSPRYEGDTRVRVFMDDLFLCPNCGAFYLLRLHFPEISWLEFGCLINTPAAIKAMFADIEQRKDKKEFEIKPCDQVNREQRARCAFFLREHQQKMELRAREEALREALLNPKPPSKPNVYLIGGQSHVKIGIAVDVGSRLSTLQTSSPHKLKLLKSWKCLDAIGNEKRLHKKFAKYRQNGEWFQLPDNVLQNLIAIDDLDIFLNQAQKNNLVKP